MLGTLLILAAIVTLSVVGQAQTIAPTPVTPIQHVIVIFGENRSFDHVFGTFDPRAGQTVQNLLSDGIAQANVAAGEKYGKAFARQRTDDFCSHIAASSETSSKARIPVKREVLAAEDSQLCAASKYEKQARELRDQRIPRAFFLRIL